jgi:hypothetical protein
VLEYECLHHRVQLCSPAWQEKDVGAVLRDEHRGPIAEWGALLLSLPGMQAQLCRVVAIEGALQVRLRMPPVLWHAWAALNACCLLVCRAPPDIRGSGRERGHGKQLRLWSSRPDVAICMLASPHPVTAPPCARYKRLPLPPINLLCTLHCAGTELTHCPKCGKALKPGKHHVGCSAGKSAPRQASKRSRMVSGCLQRFQMAQPRPCAPLLATPPAQCAALGPCPTCRTPPPPPHTPCASTQAPSDSPPPAFPRHPHTRVLQSNDGDLEFYLQPEDSLEEPLGQGVAAALHQDPTAAFLAAPQQQQGTLPPPPRMGQGKGHLSPFPFLGEGQQLLPGDLHQQHLQLPQASQQL